jgi:amino acid transporter/nucleotide-binding universal stress UspA family protein
MAELVVEKSGEVEVTLRRDLGLLEVLMIGIGPNIGSTIFILIGAAAGIAGPAIIVAFVLNFFVTLFTAMAYAELASAFPETGGGYLWIKEGLFPPFGFLGGWMSWVGHCIACSVYSLGFGVGVNIFMGLYGLTFFGLDPITVSKIAAVFIALVFIYLNYRGIKGAGRIEILVSFILITVIMIFLVCSAYFLFTHPENFSNYSPLIPKGTLSIFISMGFTFMVFEGYEVVAQTGEEAKDPERTVPRAMFLCIAISAILFIATAVVAIGVSGWQPLAAAGGDGSQAISYTANISVPYIGAVLVAFGIIVGSIAAVNSIVFSASRVSFAMGRDGNLPSTFGKLHPKKQTPVAALILSGAIIIGMVVLLPLNQVASVADILILLLFTLVNISAITLRRNRPDVKRHFITPWFPIIPLIGIGTKLFLAVTLFYYEPFAWYMAFAIINVGLLIHYFAKGKKEIEKVPIPVRVPRTEEELEKYRVLIPIDDPRNIAAVDLGCMVASEHNGELMLMSVVEVPSSVPISSVDRKLIDDRKKMLQKLQQHAEMNGVVTHALVTVSHEVVTAVIDTAKEESANMIIIGWKGYTHTQKRILGRKMDLILRLTPCDVLFIKSDEKLKPLRILILSGGLWHVSAATEVAAMVARKQGARVTILNVIVDEKYLERAREYSKRLTGILEAENVPVLTKEIRPETIVGGVIGESMDYDLLVMGSSAAKRWEAFDFGPLQDKIITNAKCPVLVYKHVVKKQIDEEKVVEDD